MIQFVAMPGSLLFGRLADRWGAKRAVLLSLRHLSGGDRSTPAACSTGWQFWLLGFVVALILGGSQAISRSLFAALIPPGKNAEFFGFYAISGKFASILGPLVFAAHRRTDRLDPPLHRCLGALLRHRHRPAAGGERGAGPAGSPGRQRRFVMNSSYLEPARPRLFAHRGCSARFPENTLPAFADAVAAGVPYLELDVRTTRDGEVVVHHDETLERLCGDPRAVSALPLEELRGLDAGFTFSADGGRSHPFRGRGVTVPTLAEVLAAFPQARCNIEIKQAEPPMEEATLAVIRAAGREGSVLLAAEQDAIMDRLRPLCGEIPTSLSFGEAAAFFAWLQGGRSAPYRPPGVALQIPERYGEQVLVTPDSLRAAHGVGLEVHVWTVNDPADMTRLLELGVDGLMSDDPQLLLATAGRRS